MAQIFSLNVYILAFDKESFSYNLEKIRYQFADAKPDAVIVSHASNVCGVIAPISEICRLSKPYGATNVIDMCQTMGLIDTNLNDECIDYAVFAAHKSLYGSLGLGGFIMNESLRPEPLLFGGTGIDSANPLLPADMPERYEVGSPNIQAIAGLNAALKWINDIGLDSIYETKKANHLRLITLLRQFDNIKIVSPKELDKGIGVVSVVFTGYECDNIGQILSERDIAVRTGLHCAPDAHRFLGTFPAGTVRFSVGYFNSDLDFMRLEETLTYIQTES
jgi:selenocysteine lyase/cysteine desulfurase